jgi:hypothetical protein
VSQNVSLHASESEDFILGIIVSKTLFTIHSNTIQPSEITMSKLSTPAKILVSVMVVAALVATRWNSPEKLESSPSLRGKRMLQLPDFSDLFSGTAFPTSSFPTSTSATLPTSTLTSATLPTSTLSFPTSAIPFSPGLAGVGTGFGVGELIFAGGSGSGTAVSNGGGSISPAGAGLQNSAFNSSATSLTSGFGGGVVGDGANADFLFTIPAFNPPTVP